jgi:drug/metabolite transporter (DMT)-like permease
MTKPVWTALVLLFGAVLFGEPITLPQRIETWTPLVFVVAVGSAAVFLLQVFIVQHWTASRASYVMILIPLFTLTLSAWLDQEPITSGLVLGGALVLAGVYFGALRNWG